MENIRHKAYTTMMDAITQSSGKHYIMMNRQRSSLTVLVVQYE